MTLSPMRTDQAVLMTDVFAVSNGAGSKLLIEMIWQIRIRQEHVQLRFRQY